MKFSIFTPTHNTRYLRRAALSLKEQSFRDFEWVVVTNADVTVEQVQDMLEPLELDFEMTIVRIPDFINRGIIGQIKKYACSLCTGDYLVEFDHDDELTPDCLEVLNEYIEKEDNPEFLYSDSIGCFPDGTSLTYAPECGWDPLGKVFSWRGVPYVYQEMWECSALSLCEIYWAPHHVRVWKRDYYEKIGGYDQTYEISDDHDLICRTYINGGKCVYIRQVLYVYHMHESNAHHVGNSSYEKSCLNFRIYFDDLVKEWCRREDLPILKLNTLDDIKKLKDYEENSVGAIRVGNVMTEVPICTDKTCLHKDITGCHIAVMNECHRVLNPLGFFIAKIQKLPFAKSFWWGETLAPLYDFYARAYAGLQAPYDRACRKWFTKEVAQTENYYFVSWILVPKKGDDDRPETVPTHNPWWRVHSVLN